MLIVVAILLGLILLALIDRDAATVTIGYGLGCIMLLAGACVALALVGGAFLWGWNMPGASADDGMRFLAGAGLAAIPGALVYRAVQYLIHG